MQVVWLVWAFSILCAHVYCALGVCLASLVGPYSIVLTEVLWQDPFRVWCVEVTESGWFQNLTTAYIGLVTIALSISTPVWFPPGGRDLTLKIPSHTRRFG